MTGQEQRGSTRATNTDILRRLFLAAVVACSFLGAWQPARSQPFEMGGRLELFVDTLIVDRIEGLEFRLARPVEATPSDSPPSSGHYATVIKDGDLYRLYNRGGGPAAYDGDPVEHTEYFESDDGINWRSPSLNLFEVGGSLENNVILAGQPPFSHNFSPFLDTKPGVAPEERYKALAGTRESGLVAFVSADGIRWSKLREEPVFRDGIFDSQNVSFWSEAEGCYVLYFRTWTGPDYTGLRTISRTTSPDFLDWDEPVYMDPNEAGEHLYTSGTHPYFRAPHIYVALPTRFQPERGNSTDILLMTSRGGDRFDRLFREAFIRPGLDAEYWGNRANYAALNVVPTGRDEMSIYVRGRRFTLRTDGFSSIHAGFDEGMLATKPIVFAGGRLVVNVSTSAGGYLLAAMEPADGSALPDYSLARADTLTGDGIALELSWGGATDVSSVAGTPVILRFVLKEADLYAIQFKP